MNGKVWKRTALDGLPDVYWHPTAWMLEAVDHVAAGLHGEEIAGLMGTNHRAVKHAVHSVAVHWNISARTGLVGEAFRRGYLVGTPGPRVRLGDADTALIRACALGCDLEGISKQLGGVHRSTVSRRRSDIATRLEARNIVHAVAIWQARGEPALQAASPWQPGVGFPKVAAYYMQVLELLATGATHAQIAARLGVPLRSVQTRVAWLRDAANRDEDAGVVGWAYWTHVLQVPARPLVAAAPEIGILLSHIARGSSLQEAAELMELSELQLRVLLRDTLRLLRVRTPTGLVTAAFAAGILMPWSAADGTDDLVRPLAA